MCKKCYDYERKISDERGYVYYGRKGNLIKIGQSRSPRRRAKQLELDELLAVERGGYKKERARQDQFRAHLAEGQRSWEWFKPSKELLDHIASLPKPLQFYGERSY